MSKMSEFIYLPEIQDTQDLAIDIVVKVINKAKSSLGERPNLYQLAHSRDVFGKAKINTTSLTEPIGITGEELIRESIEKRWKLTPTLQYYLRYMGISEDESCQYRYFEAIFSQPTSTYPIPQVTASVFFRIQVARFETVKVPNMIFRLEGGYYEQDVRYVALQLDWILALMEMKTRVFRRVEQLKIF